MIGQRYGRYRVESSIGRGGMGSVWKARDEIDGTLVALKLIGAEHAASEKFRRRFLHESRAASLLDHPSLARVLDSGDADGTLYIAFALLEGEPLAQVLAKGPLSSGRAVALGLCLADALAHAHRRGVLHRDISSRNVVVGGEGRVWLIDFGLALLEGESRVTTADTLLGTLPYLSPEALVQSTDDPRSDLYALGVVLYEMLTGVLPFGAERREALVYRILHDDPPPPRSYQPAIPESLERIVMRLLAKRAGDRYADAEGLCAALRDVATAPGAAANGADEPPAPAHAGSRRTVLAVRPFEVADLAGNADETLDRLAAGWTRSLCASLAGIPALDVLPPEGWDTRSVGAASLQALRACGAHRMLSGSLQRVPGQLRVAFSLTDARTGTQIAGQTLTRPDHELFQLQDALTATLREAVDPGGATTVGVSAPVVDDPAHPERYLQALGYLERRDNEASVDAAIGLLRGIVETGGDRARYHAALARAYIAKYHHTAELLWEARAAAACHRARELDPDLPETVLTYAAVLRAAGRHDEAIQQLRSLVARNGETFDSLHGCAASLEQLGRFEEAEDHCRRAIALRPESWQGYDQLGRMLFLQGRFALAVEPWRNVVRLLPDSARAHYRLAAAYFHADRFDTALAAYRRSIEIEPRAESWSGLGTVHYYEGRYDEARAAFEKGVLLKPGQPMMWGNLAAACSRAPGQEQRSREALSRAVALTLDRLALNPNDAEDWAWLATWRAELGERARALEAVDRALKLGPHHATVLVQSGIALERLGERQRATETIGDAVRRGFGIERLRRDPDLAGLFASDEFLRAVGLVHTSTSEPGGRT
jgi:serine/threonine-protein kinase